MQRLNKYVLAGALALAAEIALFAVLPIPEPQEAPITHAARTETPTEPITARATEIPVETVKAAYTVTETVTEPEETAPESYDIPLQDDLQDYLIGTARSYGLDPALVIAVIWRESCYQVDAVGDAGQAIGLMQIQPRWHQERMDRLGVTDLGDPRSNILVGCDILSEVIGQYGVTGGLTYYRWGRPDGDGAYAAEVLAYAGTAKFRKCKEPLRRQPQTVQKTTKSILFYPEIRQKSRLAAKEYLWLIKRPARYRRTTIIPHIGDNASKNSF